MMTPFVSKVLAIARMELGEGERGGNNIGLAIERYRMGSPGSGPWCAWFVSFCYVEAAALCGITLPFKPTGGAKRLYKRVGRAGSFSTHPEVGDVVAWNRGRLDSWKGHCGLVVEVQYPSFWTIEGNVGRYPALVAEYRHELDESRLLGFARLEY